MSPTITTKRVTPSKVSRRVISEPMQPAAPARAAGAVPPADVDPDVLSSPAPQRSNRPWLFASVGGLVSTCAVFLFLGSLQPPLSGSERIDLPAILKIDFNLTQAKKAPPPPRPERQEKAEPRKRRRPKQQKKSLTRKPMTRPVRSVQTAAVQRVRPEIASAMEGLTLMAAGAGGVGNLMLNTSLQAQDVAHDAEQLRQYNQRRRKIREAKTQRERDAVMQGATPPQLVTRPRRIYPIDARKKELEGDVWLRVLVSIQGTIEDYEILKAVPEGFFEEALIESLPRWQFRPATDGSGRPIEYWKSFKYEFRLEDA